MAVAPDAAQLNALQHAESHDIEGGVRPPKQSQPGRVDLPGSARTSLSRSRSQRTNGDGDDASEFPWGPSHPCFPHPNPHVPLNSELYETTRIIRIKRDWMVKGDLAPTFANLYPEILDPLITEDNFRDLIKKINDSLVAAFDPFTFRAWLDAVMGVATFWLWEDVGLSGVKRQLSELESWIDWWNREVGEKEAVKIIPLRRTGYLTVSFYCTYASFIIACLCQYSWTSRSQTRILALTTAQYLDQTPEKTSLVTFSRRTKITATTLSQCPHYKSTPCHRLSRASRSTHWLDGRPVIVPLPTHLTPSGREEWILHLCLLLHHGYERLDYTPATRPNVSFMSICFDRFMFSSIPRHNLVSSKQALYVVRLINV